MIGSYDIIYVFFFSIQNYNKSRIHSSRGVRFVEMALDGKLIFIGEIARYTHDIFYIKVCFHSEKNSIERNFSICRVESFDRKLNFFFNYI